MKRLAFVTLFLCVFSLACTTGNVSETAAPRSPGTQPVPVDDSRVEAKYANFCRITGTPEELIIDFGHSSLTAGGMADDVSLTTKKDLVTVSIQRSSPQQSPPHNKALPARKSIPHHAVALLCLYRFLALPPVADEIRTTARRPGHKTGDLR